MTNTPHTELPPLHIERVEYDDPRARELRARMDAEMTAVYSLGRDPDEPVEKAAARDAALAVHPEKVRATLLVVDPDGTALGHAVLYDRRGEWEVKRVIVDASQRGRGIGRLLMAALERVAGEGGAERMILQTGDRQPDAVALYEKVGWTPIPTYEPYVTTIPQSICFEKRLDGGVAGR